MSALASAGAPALRADLVALAAAVRGEGHNLQRRPDLLWQQVVNRLQHRGTEYGLSQLWPLLVSEVVLRRSSPPAPWMQLKTDVYESPALVQTLVGHGAQVTSCRFAPATRSVVSGSVDRTARTWTLPDGALERVMRGHRAPIEACAVDPLGSSIVTASSDRTLKIWDAVSAEEPMTLTGHEDAVNCCAFGPNGTWLVSGSRDCSWRVWDTSTGHCLLVVDGYDQPITACAVNPEGTLIATSSGEVATLWQLEHGQTLHTLHGHSDFITACAFSHDGRRLVTSGWDGFVKVWSAESGGELASIAHGCIATSATFSPDDRLVFSSDVAGTVHAWDVVTSSEVVRIAGHAGPIEECAVNQDATLVLTAGDDYTLKVWNLDTALAEGSRSSEERGVRFAAFTDGGDIMVADPRHIRVLEVRDVPHGRPLRSILCGDEISRNHFCDGTGNVVGGVGADGTVRVRSFDQPEVLELVAPQTTTTSCDISADGRLVAGGMRDGTVTVWDVRAARAPATLSGHDERVTGCAFSPDHSRVVSSSWDETLLVWDLTTNRRIVRLSGHEDRVSACAFSPDGIGVLSASWDGTVRLWDAATGRQMSELIGHEGRVACCCLSPDGRMAASGGDDESVIVWDLTSATELMRFIGVGSIDSCDFDRTGRGLCCVDRGGNLYLFDLIGVCDVTPATPCGT